MWFGIRIKVVLFSTLNHWLLYTTLYSQAFIWWSLFMKCVPGQTDGLEIARASVLSGGQCAKNMV